MKRLTTRLLSIILPAFLLCAAGGTVLAAYPGAENLENMPDRGVVSWNDWKFDYHIENTSMEGLTLRNVFYKGQKVLARASLPVVRVKYRGDGKHIYSGCGPFPDRFFSFNPLGLLSPALSMKTIRPFPGKPNLSNVVRFTSEAKSGVVTLGLYVYAKIGGYLLWHGWNLTSDGRMDAVVYSSGWSCGDGVIRNDHRHHPYWRMVFHIDDNENELWELRGPAGKLPAARKVRMEENFTRGKNEEISLVVSSKKSARHALIRFPAEVAEAADPSGTPWFAFSSIDAAVRRYRPEEDKGWLLDAADELPDGRKDTIESGFNALWLVNHMGHPYRPGKDDEQNVSWHGSWISIQLVNW